MAMCKRLKTPCPRKADPGTGLIRQILRHKTRRGIDIRQCCPFAIRLYQRQAIYRFRFDDSGCIVFIGMARNKAGMFNDGDNEDGAKGVNPNRAYKSDDLWYITPSGCFWLYCALLSRHIVKN
jgi:hypothetical protein